MTTSSSGKINFNFDNIKPSRLPGSEEEDLQVKSKLNSESDLIVSLTDNPQGPGLMKGTEASLRLELEKVTPDGNESARSEVNAGEKSVPYKTPVSDKDFINKR